MYIVTHRSLKMIELKQTLIGEKLERVGGYIYISFILKQSMEFRV